MTEEPFDPVLPDGFDDEAYTQIRGLMRLSVLRIWRSDHVIAGMDPWVVVDEAWSSMASNGFRSVEVVNNASFMFVFPMTFIANTFVPSQNLPSVLRTVAEWNPVSALAQASREAFGNAVPYTSTSDAWSLNHPVAYVLMWVAAILAVFVPLAVREYGSTKESK